MNVYEILESGIMNIRVTGIFFILCNDCFFFFEREKVVILTKLVKIRHDYQQLASILFSVEVIIVSINVQYLFIYIYFLFF